MTRNFKFRIWDKNKKIFLPLEQEYSSDYSSPPPAPLMDIAGRLWGWASQHWGTNNELVKSPDDYIIQQYTGLQDKNGKDIYEGDLLCFKDNITADNSFGSEPNGYVYLEDSIYEVIFNEKLGGFEPNFAKDEDWKYKRDTRHLMINRGCEVIGNVYKNFELLNNEK